MSLRHRITSVLRRHPHSSALDLLARLNRGATFKVSKREINSTLYADRGALYKVDGQQPPRWRLTTMSLSVATSAYRKRNAARFEKPKHRPPKTPAVLPAGAHRKRHV